jgi:hypothetical protein
MESGAMESVIAGLAEVLHNLGLISRAVAGEPPATAYYLARSVWR